MTTKGKRNITPPRLYATMVTKKAVEAAKNLTTKGKRNMYATMVTKKLVEGAKKVQIRKEKKALSAKKKKETSGQKNC